jgi:branched-chain amino acid transport system permease protein
MEAPGRWLMLAVVVAIIALAFVPPFADRSVIQLLTRAMTMAVFAMSLGLLTNCVGLVSLGHSAFFGLAGYFLALLSPADGPASIWLALPLALAGTAVAAAVIGALSIRATGIYFIMVTLAFTQMLYFLFHDNRGLGGSDGLFINFRPSVEVFGTRLLSLDYRPTLFYVALGAMALTFVAFAVLLRSPFGKVIQGIRVNEHRMRALGYDTYRYKLVAFVIAGTFAGLAGFLYGVQFGFVNPRLMSWQESGQVLMMVILGGMGSQLGPAIGAFAIVLLEDYFQGLMEQWLLLMGVFVVLVGMFLPRGLAGLLRVLGPRNREAE